MSDPADPHQWLAYALQDLTAANVLLRHADVPGRIACFLAQQAAEKALSLPDQVGHRVPQDRYPADLPEVSANEARHIVALAQGVVDVVSRALSRRPEQGT